MTQQLQQIIENAWDNRAQLSPASAPAEVQEAVAHVIDQLDSGKLRVATREGVGQWTVHQWIKKAVLLSFRLNDNKLMGAGDMAFFDKVPTKFEGWSENTFREAGFRAVPGAVRNQAAAMSNAEARAVRISVGVAGRWAAVRRRLTATPTAFPTTTPTDQPTVSPTASRSVNPKTSTVTMQPSSLVVWSIWSVLSIRFFRSESGWTR